MANESFVQLPADGVGKQVDAFAVTTSSGTTQYRQAVSIGDPTNASQVAGVDLQGNLQVESSQLNELVEEMQLQTRILKAIMFNLMVLSGQSINEESIEVS
jgi:hypothetical protein